MSSQETAVRRFFDDQATHWGRGYAPGGAMEPRVARFCEAARRRAQPGARVLDYGCGTGQVARALSTLGFRVTGADISAEMITSARQEPSEVDWLVLDQAAQLRLPFPDASFGLVVSSSVLEYVQDPRRVLLEFARILGADGALVVTVPDPAHRSRRIESVVRAALRLPGAQPLAERTRLRSYVRYLGLSVNRFSVERWAALMESCGLKPQAVRRGEALALLEATK